VIERSALWPFLYRVIKVFFSILLILLLFIFVFLCRYPGAGIHMSCTIYVSPPPFLLGLIF
jgi:hypothetical protein